MGYSSPSSQGLLPRAYIPQTTLLCTFLLDFSIFHYLIHCIALFYLLFPRLFVLIFLKVSRLTVGTATSNSLPYLTLFITKFSHFFPYAWGKTLYKLFCTALRPLTYLFCLKTLNILRASEQSLLYLNPQEQPSMVLDQPRAYSQLI